jgi:hypothetical protein
MHYNAAGQDQPAATEMLDLPDESTNFELNPE